jgi:3-isopropylmalate/(R)-2-methylmalate dehydratase small subunit
MEPLISHRGRVAVLDWTDVNTDLIIPARYLKRIERTGYGPLLFADRRYVAAGAPPIDAPEKHGPYAADFPLNRPEAQGATILLVGRNFGCGSSREHAVWAISQAGYRVLIAPGKDVGFADIFEANAFNNGLLLIELPEDQWNQIATAARQPEGIELSVNLQNQTIHLPRPDAAETVIHFQIPETQRQRLLKGLDAIAETLLHEPEIRRHEEQMPAWLIPATDFAYATSHR